MRADDRPTFLVPQEACRPRQDLLLDCGLFIQRVGDDLHCEKAAARCFACIANLQLPTSSRSQLDCVQANRVAAAIGKAGKEVDRLLQSGTIENGFVRPRERVMKSGHASR